MFKALKRLPASVAVVVMVLLMLAGIALGNQNALEEASAPAWAELEKLQKRVVEMSGKAANFLSIASRLNLNGAEIAAVETAQKNVTGMAMVTAKYKGASAVNSILNHADALETAVLALDERIKQHVDAMTDASAAKIEREARDKAYSDWTYTRLNYNEKEAYNKKAAEAASRYNALPARSLLGNQLPPLFP